jgi:hypothetical protein
LQIADWDNALASFQAGRTVMVRLTQGFPDNVGWKKDLSEFEANIVVLPVRRAQAAIETAFEVGRFKRAARLQAETANMVERLERRHMHKPGLLTATALLPLAWRQLFSREFKQALASSERAIALDPENLAYATNQAHALMFLGRPKAAQDVYLKYKARRIGEEKLWEQVILEDFAALEKQGLIHPQMAKIKVLLGSQEPVR